MNTVVNIKQSRFSNPRNVSTRFTDSSWISQLEFRLAVDERTKWMNESKFFWLGASTEWHRRLSKTGHKCHNITDLTFEVMLSINWRVICYCLFFMVKYLLYFYICRDLTGNLSFETYLNRQWAVESYIQLFSANLSCVIRITWISIRVVFFRTGT